MKLIELATELTKNSDALINGQEISNAKMMMLLREIRQVCDRDEDGLLLRHLIKYLVK